MNDASLLSPIIKHSLESSACRLVIPDGLWPDRRFQVVNLLVLKPHYNSFNENPGVEWRSSTRLILALCQQMKNMSSRIWLSSWFCQWWDHVGVKTALSPGLGVFNTGWCDTFGCPGVGLGAEMGDMMSNNFTTENSVLELKNKTKISEECLKFFTLWHGQYESRSYFDFLSTPFFSECLLNSNPGGGVVAAEEQSSLQVQEKPGTREACAFWNRNEGMCNRINKVKTGQIKLIEIQSLSLAGLINYSACRRADDGHSTYRTWIL